MATYNAPIEDMMFLFKKLRDNKHYNELEKYKEVNPDLAKDILEQAAKITENLILPLAKVGDDHPCVFENGVVRTPPGYKKTYNKFIQDGWVSLSCDPEYGGQGMPRTISTFFDERKDKSIIFWRSLPISDTYTVFSKLIVATIIAPLLIIPALLFLHLVSVTAGSVFFAVSDLFPFSWAWKAYPWFDWIRVIFSLWMQTLWSLPILTWIMLAGAYSRKPVVAAVLPPVVIVLVERVALSSNLFFDSFLERLQPWSRASSFPKEYENLAVSEMSDIPLLFGLSEFWIGILISGIFIYLTIYFRSKSDYASVE